MSVAGKIVLVLVLGIAMLILNAWLHEHRLDPPHTDWNAKLTQTHRYDATGKRLLPFVFLADVLFLGTFLWMSFEFR